MLQYRASKPHTRSRERYQQLAGDYADVLEKKQSALVISPKHREAELPTNTIRSERKNRNLLDRDEREGFILKPWHLTEGQKAVPAWPSEGQRGT